MGDYKEPTTECIINWQAHVVPAMLTFIKLQIKHNLHESKKSRHFGIFKMQKTFTGYLNGC